MSKDTGGSAFPYEYDRDDNVGGTFRDVESGMTLRDYFAIRAMQSVSLALDNNEQELIANASYQMADAMLKVRG